MLPHAKDFDKNTKWNNWKEKIENDIDANTGVKGGPMSYLIKERPYHLNAVLFVTIWDIQKSIVLGMTHMGQGYIKKNCIQGFSKAVGC